MKSSEILRRAAREVEGGRYGLYMSCDYDTVEEGQRKSAWLDAVMPEERDFSPAHLSSDIRSTILCLAAAIAEDEGD